ncbi:peptidoglycan-binding domain-containing protein [Planctellipticum variicoloris]|uniref:peptidoglycan-binding domain-containing protein n=1 Tax=Planctellipticum variicoloris TaxID=3064265 RepID=UPI00301332E2|nr:peptidoglycan-binding protein [Planctomycetaceae bacterium SH412]
MANDKRQFLSETTLSYAGFELQLGDVDKPTGQVPTYAGVKHPEQAGASHVRQLQQDLVTLRFLNRAPTGLFDIRTEWAVREFQTYAGLTKAARTTATGAEPVDFWSRYETRILAAEARLAAAEIHGVATTTTAACLQVWLRDKLRCPVVINCFRLDGNNRTDEVLAANLWAHDDHTEASGGRMFVRDWTERPGASRDDWQVLGSYLTRPNFGGPGSQAGRHTLPSGAITPLHMVGVPADHLLASQKSTFRVLYAGSFPEIDGQLDAVNAYDNAFLSFGPCQWTTSPRPENGKHGKGELPGFLAWLKDQAASSYGNLMPGVEVISGEKSAPTASDDDVVQWTGGIVRPGEQIYNMSQRKYEAYLGITASRRVGAANPPRFLRRLDTLVKPGTPAGTYDELDLFRSWHWFYRFVLAARNDDAVRANVWTMARSRLRDIVMTPFPPGVLNSIVDATVGRRAPTIGDVFQSELALAYLLRWHIRRPGHVVEDGRAGSRLIAAWRAAGLSTDITTYTDADESTLIDQIRAAMIPNVASADALDKVRDTTVPDLGKAGLTRRHDGNGFQGDFTELVQIPTRYPATGNLDWDNINHQRLCLPFVRSNLARIGFLSSTNDNDRARVAVREFKRATRALQVAIAKPIPTAPAKPPVDFESVTVTPPTGSPWPTDDVVDPAVMEALTRWRISGWATPLVVSSRVHSGNTLGDEVKANFLWNRDWPPADGSDLWVVARDVAPDFPTITGNRRNDGLVGVGQPARDANGKPTPSAFPPAQAALFWDREPLELLPNNFAGNTWSNLSPEAQATFLVLRAVSHLENSAFLDGASVDPSGRLAFLFGGLPASLPAASSPLPKNQRSRLGAFAAYLKKTDQATFDATFGRFGVNPEQEWGTNGADLFRSAQRVYSAALVWDAPTVATVPLRHLAGWTWFSRLILFTRAFPAAMARATWGFARVQLRELLRTRVTLKDFKHPASSTTLPNQPYTLGEIFTSQRAVALLFAWFLRRPEDVVNTGGVVSVDTKGVGKVLVASKPNLPLASTPAESWTDAIEQLLVNQLATQLATAANPPVLKQIPGLGGWPPAPGDTSVWHLADAQRVDLTTTRGQGDNATSRFRFPLDVSGLTQPPPAFAPAPARPGPRDQASRWSAEDASPAPAPPRAARLRDDPAERSAVQLSRARDLGAGSFGFGVALLGVADPSGNGPFHADGVGFTLPDVDGETGWEVPLAQPFDFARSLEQEASTAIRVTSANTDPELLPTFRLAANQAPVNLSLLLNLTATLPDGPQADSAVVRVDDLQRDGNDTLTGRVRLEVTLGGSGVSGHPVWVFPAAIDTTTPPTFGPLRLDQGDRIGISAEVKRDGFALGLPFSGPLAGRLFVTLTDDAAVDATFVETQSGGELKLDLGSPLARFVLPAGSPLDWSLRDGFRLTVPDGQTPQLLLDLFDKAAESAKAVIGHAWQGGNIASWLMKFAQPVADLPDELRQITWVNDRPTLSLELIAATIGDVIPEVARARELIELAPPGLANLARLATTFSEGELGPWLDFLDVQRPTLSVPLEFHLKPADQDELLHATGVLNFAFDTDEAGGRLSFKASSLRCSGSADLRTKRTTSYKAGLVKLTVPEGLTFRFEAGSDKASLALIRAAETGRGPAAAIRLEFPADIDPNDPSFSKFVFEMSEFKAHDSGFDFRGGVRAGRVGLGSGDLTGLKAPVDVQPPTTIGTGDQEPAVGEILVRNSKLVGCSLSASADLVFFDSAVGKLTLKLTEHDGSFDAAAVLEIIGLPVFHVRSLFLRFDIPYLVFATKYENKKWTSNIRMTGTISAEPPENPPNGEINELLSGFFAKRLSVSFESLDLLRLNAEAITFRCAPQSFEILEILKIEVDGLRVGNKRDPDYVNNKRSTLILGILGQASLKNLDLLNARLTFGGITLSLPLNNNVPDLSKTSIDVETIGIAITPPAGFMASGSMTRMPGGFEAELELETDFLPRTRVVGRSVPVIAGDGRKVPGFSVAAEVDVTTPLYAGFYLRSVGFGFGINNTLAGLEKSDLKGVDRVIALVRQPNGPPDPSNIKAWVDDPPPSHRSTEWTIAGVGGISYGNLDVKQEHPVVGRIMIAVDSQLEILIGANLWVYAAPARVTDPDFLARPLARAAMMVFPQEPRISAYAQTLPNPKMGDSVPEILGQAVSAIQANLSVDATPSMFEVKVGWPREIRFGYNLGAIFQAEVAAGFRFGVAGGAATFGLNLDAGLNVSLGGSAGFDTWAGSASAEISANLDAKVGLELLGALAPGGSPLRTYLVGRLQVSASLLVHASAHCRLGPKYSPLKIGFDGDYRFASVDIDGEIGMNEGTDPSSLGARAHVSVSFSICGYDLSGDLSMAWQADNVTKARQKIQELLPASAIVPSARFIGLAPAAPSRALDTARPWHYRFTRTQVNDDTRIVRVVLFPASGQLYPKPPLVPDAAFRFRLALKSADGVAFRGFRGSDRWDDGWHISDGLLQWNEDLDTKFIPVVENGQPSNVGLRELLQAFPDVPEPRLIRPELTDAWVKSPQVADASDGTSGVRPPDLYPLRRRRLPHSEGGYDNLRLRACTSPPARTPNPPSDGNGAPPPFGLPLGWVFKDLVSLLCAPQEDLTKDRFTLARPFRLVLEFEVKRTAEQTANAWEDTWKWNDPDHDPVPNLLDLGAMTPPWLAGAAATLASPIKGRTPCYELELGKTFFDATGVGLTWDFRSNDIDQKNLVATLEDHFIEVSQITVKRYRDGRFDREFPTNPTWFQPRYQSDPQAPGWVHVEGEGQDGQPLEMLLRVPYQFIDNDVASFRENEWLRYEVVVQAPNRELRRATTEVRWRTVRPLPAIRQSQVLHRLKPLAGRDGPYVPGVFEFVVAVGNADRDGPFEYARDLKIRYQWISAPRTGHYGFGARRPGSTGPIPATAPPDPDFNDFNAETDPVLWEQIPDELRGPGDQPLTWELLKVEVEGQNVEGQRLLRVVVPENDLQQQIGGARPGQAIEFFVGIAPPAGANQPITRSPLQVMRHAVLLPSRGNTPRLLDGPVEAEYFSRGNTVEAIEFLARSASTEWILGDVFDSPAVGPDRIALLWPHPESGFDVASIPVSGFRVYRVEALSPLGYPRLRSITAEGFSARCERIVDVWPQEIYRAFPRHLAPRRLGSGRLTYEARTDLTPIRDLWDGGGPRPNARVHAPALRAGPFTPELYRTASEQQFWVHPALVEVAGMIAGALGAAGVPSPRFELTLTEPLRDRGTATFTPNRALKDRLGDVLRLLPAFAEDPFGWSAAEALGLSCECVWRDASDRVIDTRLFDDERFLNALPRPLVPPPAMVVRFVAEDGETRLDTVRLMFAGSPDDWKVWDADNAPDTPVFNTAFGLLLVGRADRAQPAGLTVAQRTARLGAALAAWLTVDPDPAHPTSVFRRSRQDRWHAGQMIDLYPAEVMLPTEPVPNRARVTVPIGGGGRVRLALPIPNGLRHSYDVGVQIVRRYDEIWLALRSAATPEADQGELTFVPPEAVHNLKVPRTDPFDDDPASGGPAVLIAPTSGGVAITVFRHPAEYASTANAVSKEFFAFSGQHLRLHRDVAGGQTTLEGVYQVFAQHVDADHTVQWDAYRTWVQSERGTERPGQPFPLPIGSGDLRDGLNTVLPASLRPTAKADVFVVPAAPVYYDYLAESYCEAGQVRSPVTQTGTVRPLFRRPSQWPQASCYNPRAVTLAEPNDQGESSLTLDLPLPHPRQYLAEELRQFWFQSDIELNIGATCPFLLGSLPDLFARLTVHMWDLQPDYQEGGTKVILPLIEVFSPLAPSNPSGDEPKWYVARCSQLSAIRAAVISLIQPPSGADVGRLELRVRLTFKMNEPNQAEVYHRLQRLSVQPKTRWFHLRVERSGVMSDFWPPLDGAGCPEESHQ